MTTIEQLVADYRAKLATYEQAKEELASHLCGVEAALSRLELAGDELGLVVKVRDYTGSFYNRSADPALLDLDDICDGCGKSFGDHVGMRCNA